MKDTRAENKKKLIWPWILLVILVGIAIYFFAFREDGVDEKPMEQAVENPERVVLNDESISTIEDYEMYVKEDKDMGLDHEFTHTALSKLIAAVGASAEALELDVSSDLNEASQNADDITKDPLSLDHADKIRKAGDLIVRALDKIQSEKYPDMGEEMDAVRAASQNIMADSMTLDQREDVKEFFQTTMRLLSKMK